MTSKSSISKTPQAKDDAFKGIKEDSGIVILDVMSNDLGGNAKRLYSVGNGGWSNDDGRKDDDKDDRGENGKGSHDDDGPKDLLAQNKAGAVEFSTLGVRIWITADGKLAYDTHSPVLQSLAAGQSLTDSFDYAIQLGNGTLSWATAQVTVTGTNDVPVIDGVSAGVVSEDAGASLTTSGTLTIADPDRNESGFIEQTAVAGNYGGFTVNAAGNWTYAADNAQDAIQRLGEGESLTDSFAVVSLDGTSREVVSVTINGANDAAVIGGPSASAVQEDSDVVDGKLAVAGSIGIADVDQGQAAFRTEVAAAAGTLGSLAISGDGGYLYTVDNEAVQALGAGETRVETFIVTSLDGTQKEVNFTIVGVNDVAAIDGVTATSVSEDADTVMLAVRGALTIADADRNQSRFIAQDAVQTTYGNLTLNADGHWTYTADNSQNAIQKLAAGESLTDSFTVASLDGTASRVVTVTINGVNDAALIGGMDAAVMSEDDATAGGTLTIADADHGEAAFAEQSVSGSSGYGVFNVDAAGKWTYQLNQELVQYLHANESLTDSFTVASLDGTASRVVTVTINGANDAAVIGVPSVSNVKEDSNVVAGKLAASGTISITDVDRNDAAFSTSVTRAAGTLGTLTLAADGSYVYSVDNSAVQYLNPGTRKIDTFTVMAVDGTQKVVSVTINGVNDAAVIGGVDKAVMSEDAATAGGTLTIDDADRGEAAFVEQSASGSNGYGVFNVDAAGNWAYQLNRGLVQYLHQNESVTDSFTVASLDGTASRVVSVTINGANDAAVIGGVDKAVMSEDAATAGGTLSIADADRGEAAFVEQAASGSSGYGVFKLDAAGSWTYQLNRELVQYLRPNESLTDSFTVASLDGTASRVVSVTINGANDAAVIGVPSVSNVKEDSNVVAGKLVASGTISITDVDRNDAAFSTSVTRAAGTLGTLTLAADGSYVYSVDNSAVQYLNPGTRKIDTFTVKAVDDTQKQVSFTINAADRLAPKILFVDDDGGAASSNTWLSILRDLNYTVDSQVLAVDGDPTNLSNYDMVIWAAGDHVGNLTAANVTNLSSYLDNGGNLLYSGKLHGEPSAFVDKYLGVRNYNDNFAYTTYTTYPADAEGIGFLVGRTPHDVRNFSWFYFGKGNSGGNAMSMFGMATARSVVELIDDAGLAYFDGSKDHHVAAFNQTEQFHTATMGFDINQLDPAYRYGLMDKLVQLVGGASWQDVF